MELGDLQLQGWADEAIATAQIEGEILQVNSVRASAARRLGLADAKALERDARTEATLDVLQAAIEQSQQSLSHDTLYGWQAALFPTGRSVIQKIRTGAYRDHPEPMQIVTPRLGKPDIVHYQAPDSDDVHAQMARLIAWFNSSLSQTDGLMRAALAHLWLEAIHPLKTVTAVLEGRWSKWRWHRTSTPTNGCGACHNKCGSTARATALNCKRPPGSPTWT